MELILKKTIDTLGEEGDIVKVKPGYGRNYLLPQGLAVPATPGNLATLERQRAAIEARKAKIREEAEKLAARITGTTLVIEQMAGDEGRLFGSVTAADIANRLAELGIEVDRKKIMLAEPIKSTGEYGVTIKIAYQVSAEVRVQVVPVSEDKGEAAAGAQEEAAEAAEAADTGAEEESA